MVARKKIVEPVKVIDKVWSEKYRCWLTKSDAYMDIDGIWKNRNIEKEIGVLWIDSK
jgi:hypothetical protein